MRKLAHECTFNFLITGIAEFFPKMHKWNNYFIVFEDDSSMFEILGHSKCLHLYHIGWLASCKSLFHFSILINYCFFVADLQSNPGLLWRLHWHHWRRLHNTYVLVHNRVVLISCTMREQTFECERQKIVLFLGDVTWAYYMLT